MNTCVAGGIKHDQNFKMGVVQHGTDQLPASDEKPFDRTCVAVRIVQPGQDARHARSLGETQSIVVVIA